MMRSAARRISFRRPPQLRKAKGDQGKGTGRQKTMRGRKRQSKGPKGKGSKKHYKPASRLK